jgi:hypothetical protein
LLSIVEAEGFVDAMFAVEAEPDQPVVPMVFAGELVVDGTLDELLHTIDVVLTAL